jgi:hypothetical protein
MTNDLMTVLDECLERIRRGETVEQCLADHPDLRRQLEPLLITYQQVKTIHKASPTPEFKKAAHNRLMSRIKWERPPVRSQRAVWFDFARFRHSLAFKALVPVTVLAMIALLVWFVGPAFSPLKIKPNIFTLSVLSGGAEIKRAGSAEWVNGQDGMHLEVGSEVRTPTDSYAVLTFFDSSTVKLEPQARVLVSRSEFVAKKSSFIILEQQSGKTWSYVAADREGDNYFAIHTPQGNAIGAETAFSTEVGNSGKTTFAVAEGTIQVIKGNREMQVEADKQIEVGDRGVLSAPLPVSTSGKELIISSTLPGIASLCDPNGASTGHFPDGVAFNQITNSKAELTETNQKISITQAINGEYLLSVRKSAPVDIPIDIQARQNGLVIFQYKDTLSGNNQDGWIVHIQIGSGAQTAVSVAAIEPLKGKSPENVVETGLAKKNATPIAALRVNSPGTSQPAINNTTSPVSSSITTPGSGTTPASATQTPVTTPAITPPVVIPAPVVTTPVITPSPTPIPQVSPAADLSPPVIVSTYPASGANNVDVNKDLAAVFSEALQGESINPDTFKLLKNDSPITGQVSYDNNSRMAIFIPAVNLEAEVQYTAVIETKARDLAGNHLSENYIWNFTTAARLITREINPPSVLSVSPGDNYTGMPVNIILKTVFDEAMAPESFLNKANFSLTAGGVPVEYGVAYNAISRTAIYTPDASLPYKTECTAVIHHDITDVSGNPMTSDYIWKFTTGSPSQIVTLSLDSPEAAKTNGALDVRIYISNVSDLNAFEFDLSFDSTLIQPVQGAFLGRGVISSSSVDISNLNWAFVQNDPGHVRILGQIKGPAINGSGYLLTMHFKVKGKAGNTCLLTMAKTKIGHRTYDYLFDSKGNTIAANAINSWVTIVP